MAVSLRKRERTQGVACKRNSGLRGPSGVRNDFVYDAGVLIAADRNDRRVWADHEARLHLDAEIVTSDTNDIEQLVRASGRAVAVVAV